MDAAAAIVAHAGMGTILTALETGKRLLVMPRRAALGEHRNDHQLATVSRSPSWAASRWQSTRPICPVSSMTSAGSPFARDQPLRTRRIRRRGSRVPWGSPWRRPHTKSATYASYPRFANRAAARLRLRGHHAARDPRLPPRRLGAPTSGPVNSEPTSSRGHHLCAHGGGTLSGLCAYPVHRSTLEPGS